jgi:preprotein translocase subunit SecF
MVNLAVNQTLVRSINTSIVGVLPVASILFIGSILLGAGTLRDIALVMMVGTIVGTYSSVFLAAPVYAHLRENEPALKSAADKVLAARG